VIDLENYREKREHNLKFVAQKICEKVLQERCTITLKPMNAYDRRLVHMEVTRYPELASRSLGEGQMKRLQIYVDPRAGS
jgi:spoIIIJ-associated protein